MAWAHGLVKPLSVSLARPAFCTEQHRAAISTCVVSSRPPRHHTVLWPSPPVAVVHSARSAHTHVHVTPAPCSRRPPSRPLRFSMRQEPRPVPYMRDDQ